MRAIALFVRIRKHAGDVKTVISDRTLLKLKINLNWRKNAPNVIQIVRLASWMLISALVVLLIRN